VDYLTAWQEGYTSGQEFALKLVNETLNLDLNKVSELVVYIGSLEEQVEDLKSRVLEMENFYD
jgi:hypothetical protein